MGIAWTLTRLRYPDHDDYENLTFDWMRTRGENEYTSLFIDLIDDHNQGLGPTNINRPFDRVTGYSMAELERWLGRCSNIQDLQRQLADKYRKPDNIHLNELFTQYINLRR